MSGIVDFLGRGLGSLRMKESPEELLIQERSVLPLLLAGFFMCAAAALFVFLTVTGEGTFPFRLYVVFSILLPIILILGSPQATKFITVRVNKKKNILSASSSTFFKYKEFKECALSDIKEIAVFEEGELGQGMPEAARIIYIILRLKDGSEVRLPKFPVFLYNLRRVIREKKIAERIAGFLKIPFRMELKRPEGYPAL